MEISTTLTILSLGTWNSGAENAAVGYTGPIFGPTSLIINNECNGEDLQEPGGESLGNINQKISTTIIEVISLLTATIIEWKFWKR